VLCILNSIIVKSNKRNLIDNDIATNNLLSKNHQNDNFYKLEDYNQENSNDITGRTAGGVGGGENDVSNSNKNNKNVDHITVKVGQQAMLPCFVNNLGSHKVILYFYI
jgi:hypothetical protein